MYISYVTKTFCVHYFLKRPPPVELKPCDPIEMQKPASDLEPVILEATNLGRGLGTPNIEVFGEVKEGDLVTTLGMTVWLVTQNKHFVLPKPSEGHFHSGLFNILFVKNTSYC